MRGAPAPYTENKPKHGKNPAVGMKKVVYSPSIVLEQEDARSFKQDEEITLMNWGNAIVREIKKSGDTVTELVLDLHLEGDVKKTEKKVTWLATEGQDLVPAELLYFDHILTKDSLQEEDDMMDFISKNLETKEDAVTDCNVAELKEGDIIQFERKGYYRLDKPYSPGKPAVFINVPSGKGGR